MTRARCETCHRPMASTADWERTYVAHSGGESALCWSGDALCKSPPRVLVREWWELWRGRYCVALGYDDADLRRYRAQRVLDPALRLKRVRRYRVAR